MLSCSSCCHDSLISPASFACPLQRNQTLPWRDGKVQPFICSMLLYFSLSCRRDRRVAAMATVAVGGREQGETRWTADLFSLMLGWRGSSEGGSVVKTALMCAPQSLWRNLNIFKNLLQRSLWQSDERAVLISSSDPWHVLQSTSTVTYYTSNQTSFCLPVT